jgi:hypothetical protein
MTTPTPPPVPMPGVFVRTVSQFGDRCLYCKQPWGLAPDGAHVFCRNCRIAPHPEKCPWCHHPWLPDAPGDVLCCSACPFGHRTREAPPEPRPASVFIAGLDLGQVQDPTALAIAETRKDEYGERVYNFRDLKRWPLGTSYPDIVQDVGDRLYPLGQGAYGDPFLILDATGCGRPVADMFAKAGLPCKLRPVIITAGHQDIKEGRYFHVSKRNLVGAVSAALQARRLHVSPKLDEAGTLVKELQNFKVKVNVATGSESFEAWRERDHDDLVLAVALSVWFGDHAMRRLWVA